VAALHNYFFALQPDGAATARIGEVTQGLLRRRPGLGRPMAPQRLHVSVKSVGVDERPMDDWAERAAAAVGRVRFPTFMLAFNRLAAFGGGREQRALVLRGDEGVLGVDLLRAAIHEALVKARLTPRRQPAFEAHVTLVRGAYDGPELFIAPVAWWVREFVLIHSFVGETRYEVAGRFPLTG